MGGLYDAATLRARWHMTSYFDSMEYFMCKFAKMHTHFDASFCDPNKRWRSFVHATVFGKPTVWPVCVCACFAWQPVFRCTGCCFLVSLPAWLCDWFIVFSSVECLLLCMLCSVVCFCWGCLGWQAAVLVCAMCCRSGGVGWSCSCVCSGLGCWPPDEVVSVLLVLG